MAVAGRPPGGLGSNDDTGLGAPPPAAGSAAEVQLDGLLVPSSAAAEAEAWFWPTAEALTRRLSSVLELAKGALDFRVSGRVGSGGDGGGNVCSSGLGRGGGGGGGGSGSIAPGDGGAHEGGLPDGRFWGVPHAPGSNSPVALFRSASPSVQVKVGGNKGCGSGVWFQVGCGASQPG